MNNTDNIQEVHSKDEYNSIPVVYCKNCLSIKIMVLDDSMDYCDECGSTDTGSTDIDSWKEMYQKKYNKPY